jgi:hypothetical protein
LSIWASAAHNGPAGIKHFNPPAENGGGFSFGPEKKLESATRLNFSSLRWDNSRVQYRHSSGEIMKIAWALPFSILCLCATLSVAQTDAKATAYPPTTLSGGISLRSVAGAPFSADVVQQFTQLMPDGTRLARETQGKMFRDAAGRTRSETELVGATAGTETRRYVTIFDPVEQLNIRLDLQTKIATIFPFPSNTGPVSHDVEIKLAKALAVRNANGARQQDMVAAQDMGPSTMQGFAVTGKRRTLPAEARPAGSEKARNVVVETWFSPELKIELQARTEDPALGVRTTKLVNIANGEPDSALFQIPADYTIQDNSLRK